MTRASDFTVEAFRPEHFGQIELQPAQAHTRAHTTLEHLERLACGHAYTLREGSRVILCGGLAEIDYGRGMLWSYISRDAGAHFVRMHRYVSRFIATLPHHEITATCQEGFAQGRRWLELLDFTFVRALGPWGPARVPHDLYVRR